MGREGSVDPGHTVRSVLRSRVPEVVGVGKWERNRREKGPCKHPAEKHGGFRSAEKEEVGGWHDR